MFMAKMQDVVVVGAARFGQLGHHESAAKTTLHDFMEGSPA